MLIEWVLREEDMETAPGRREKRCAWHTVHTQLIDRCSTLAHIHHSQTVWPQVLMWSQFESIAVDDAFWEEDVWKPIGAKRLGLLLQLVLLYRCNSPSGNNLLKELKVKAKGWFEGWGLLRVCNKDTKRKAPSKKMKIFLLFEGGCWHENRTHFELMK